MQPDDGGPFPGRPDEVDRRVMLGRGATILGGLLAGLSLRPRPAYGQAKPKVAGQQSDNAWNVVVVGEAMVSRPFSMHTDPDFLSIVRLMRESDVTYAHCEMNFGDLMDLKWAAKSSGSSFMIAEPRVAEDLKWAGVDVMSLAHNHSMDWGAPGMLSTIKACSAAGRGSTPSA